jgi:hypothetical protein
MDHQFERTKEESPLKGDTVLVNGIPIEVDWSGSRFVTVGRGRAEFVAPIEQFERDSNGQWIYTGPLQIDITPSMLDQVREALPTAKEVVLMGVGAAELGFEIARHIGSGALTAAEIAGRTAYNLPGEVIKSTKERLETIKGGSPD